MHRTMLIACVFVLALAAVVFIPPAPAQQVHLLDQLQRDLAEHAFNLTAGVSLNRAADVCEAMKTNHRYLVETASENWSIGEQFQALVHNHFTYAATYHAMLETYLEDIRIRRPDFQCYEWQ